MSITVSSPTNNIPTRPTNPVRFGHDEGKHGSFTNGKKGKQTILKQLDLRNLQDESSDFLTDESGDLLTIE